MTEEQARKIATRAVELGRLWMARGMPMDEAVMRITREILAMSGGVQSVGTLPASDLTRGESNG